MYPPPHIGCTAYGFAPGMLLGPSMIFYGAALELVAEILCILLLYDCHITCMYPPPDFLVRSAGAGGGPGLSETISSEDGGGRVFL
jgi:hypothetical protein